MWQKGAKAKLHSFLFSENTKQHPWTGRSHSTQGDPRQLAGRKCGKGWYSVDTTDKAERVKATPRAVLSIQLYRVTHHVVPLVLLT